MVVFIPPSINTESIISLKTIIILAAANFDTSITAIDIDAT